VLQPEDSTAPGRLFSMFKKRRLFDRRCLIHEESRQKIEVTRTR
jgi:hypothetical protein